MANQLTLVTTNSATTSNTSSASTSNITPGAGAGSYLFAAFAWQDTTITLSSVANSVGSTAIYTGTVTNGGSNAFAGFTYIVSGFTNGVNNGTFLCTASTTTTLTLQNSAASAETHAATAIPNNIGDVTGVTDSGQGLTWNRIGTTAYSTNTNNGSVGLSLWYAIATSNASTTATAALSHGPFNGVGGGICYFLGANTPYFDTESSPQQGTGTSVTSNSVSPNPTTTGGLIFVSASNSTANTLSAGSLATGFNLTTFSWNITSRLAGQYYPFVGTGLSTQTPPLTFTSTYSVAAADWVNVLAAIPTGTYKAQAQGDTFQASGGDFLPLQFSYVSGLIFAGGYTGLLFMKNVFLLPRDYWDTALSTPYSGQLFPVGAGQGTPGQVYPF